MSDNEYIAKNWEPGDKVFAEDLNRMDSAIEELYNNPPQSGPMVVTFRCYNYIDDVIPQKYQDMAAMDSVEFYFEADKTFEEILTAFEAGNTVLYKLIIDSTNTTVEDAMKGKFYYCGAIDVYSGLGIDSYEADKYKIRLGNDLAQEYTNLSNAFYTVVNHDIAHIYNNRFSTSANMDMQATENPSSGHSPKDFLLTDYPVAFFGYVD